MPAGAHKFPHQPTPFIAREDEVAAILRSFADPACRLLTLIGPGGVGKTRLAVESASIMAKEFTKGAYFVDLAIIRDASHIATAIAEVLNAPLSGREKTQDQLFDFIGEKELLLVLDNFEHLTTGADVILAMLASAPEVKIIITSREALNVRQEWLYPVSSLPYPPEDFSGEIEQFGSVQLLLKSIQRVSPEFSIQNQLTGVVRICRVVEGMPLALEMAAAWTKTLSCDQIADEIEAGIDILTTTLNDVPDRHRSIQAIFNQSWLQINQEQRQAFSRISVFNGGFDRVAAQHIAGTSLPVLSSLVNKSLIRFETEQRYQVHGLIRQFAEEKLKENPEDEFHTSATHCSYYSFFLGEKLDGILGGHQIQAITEIDGEELNCRAAWKWAVAHLMTQQLIESAQALATYWAYKGRYLEIRDSFENAKSALDLLDKSEKNELARLHVYLILAWNYLRTGEPTKSEQLAVASREIYDRLGTPHIQGDGSDPAIILGTIASIKGDNDAVVRYGNEAIQQSELNDHILNRKFGYYLLSSASLAQGQYELAHSQASQSLALAKQVGDEWYMAYCLNQIGQAEYNLGNYEVAKQHFDESYAIREAFNDPEGMALALIHLGKIDQLQGDFQGSENRFLRSLKIYEEINDKGGLAAAHRGLGDTSLENYALIKACQHYHHALELSGEIQYLSLTFSIFIGIGKLMVQAGQTERGLELLSIASIHPASEYETKKQAQSILQQYQKSQTAAQNAKSSSQGQAQDIELIVNSLLIELPAMDLSQSLESYSEVDPQERDQTLIEPLTDREMEVLALIADGLTNKQIAAQLVISPGTAKWYSSQIYSKLGVSSRTQAVAFARQHKIIS
jgi:predicted ATPase/DNA-binding CsgD family transcriptional regulator